MHQRVESAGSRAHRRELGNCQCTKKCVNGAEDPHRHEQRHRWEARRDLTRRTQDAHADGVADKDSEAERDPENPQQAASRRRITVCDPAGQRVGTVDVR